MKDTAKKSKYEVDMLNGALLPRLLLFTLPLMLSGILQLLFNAADIVVVGKFAGDNALAAVGSNGSLINLLTNLFVGLSIGTNVLVSRYYGAGKHKELKKTIHTSIALSIVSGILLTVVGIVCGRKILSLMSVPKEVIGLSTLYIKIYFLGMTSTMVYNFGSAILRAVGDTGRPLLFLLLSGVINVVLNLIFVIAFKMSVAGVAIATVISQTVAAVLIIVCLMKEKEPLRLCIKEIGFDGEKLVQIVKIGVPAGIQGVVFSLSNVVIQSSVNSFGAIQVAGNSAAQNIEGFVYVAMNACYQAAISFTSQNMGAGNFKRVDKIAVRCIVLVVCIGIVLGNGAVLLGKPLLSIYSGNKAVIKAGLIRLRIIGGTYALCGTMDVLVGCLRGRGYSVVPMIVSLIGACGLRLLWLATVFQIDKYHTVNTIYISYPISWTVTLLAHLITLFIVRRKFNRTKINASV